MRLPTTFAVMVISCGFLGAAAKAQLAPSAGSDTEANEPNMTLTCLDMNDTRLVVRYEIRNYSQRDAWVLSGSYNSSLAEDGQTLVISRRLNVPIRVVAEIFYGTYVRLRAGRTQQEEVLIPFPLQPHHGLEVGRRSRGLGRATRLKVELGYYTGDLPQMIQTILEKARSSGERNFGKPLGRIDAQFGGVLGFNKRNEDLPWRDDMVVIPYTYQDLPGEQTLQIAVDDLDIPYEEEEDLRSAVPAPDLAPYGRASITYEPSMLAFYFPYEGQRYLLTEAELEYAQSKGTIQVTEPQHLKLLADDIKEGMWASGLVRRASAARVVCYRGAEEALSFPIVNGASVVVDRTHRFVYPRRFPSLRVISPRIGQIELRLRCAAHLKDLWHRLRLYRLAKEPQAVPSGAGPEIAYPSAGQWCDSMLRAFLVTPSGRGYPMNFKCPSASEGKCHYAMNPNCKPNSPGDTVLLFETKAGWNQHGGPELFTFDNHDPKGGCVLLNDGTVRFIRTEEELKQLRWKP